MIGEEAPNIIATETFLKNDEAQINLEAKLKEQEEEEKKGGE